METLVCLPFVQASYSLENIASDGNSRLSSLPRACHNLKWDGRGMGRVRPSKVPEKLPISVKQNGIKDHTLSSVDLSRSWMIWMEMQERTFEKFPHSFVLMTDDV